MKKNRFIEYLAENLRSNLFCKALLRPIYRTCYTDRLIKRRNKEFLSHASELLGVFDNALKEINCQYWLEFGTLLGAVREKNFINHDLDIDIGVFKSEFSQQVSEVLEKKGFQKVHSFYLKGSGEVVEETYEYKKVSIDLFFFYPCEENKSVYCYEFIPEPGLSWGETQKKYGGFLARKLFFPDDEFVKYHFLDLVVNIPRNYKQHLSVHYGDDFMTPDPNWDLYQAQNVMACPGEVGIENKF